jgi:hypothetical protein
MKKASHIISIMLVLVMLSSGMPLFHKHDICRNFGINLKDVIIVVKDVAQLEDVTTSFAEKVGQVLSTLNVAAGLKTVIQPQKHNATVSSFPFSDFLMDHQRVTCDGIFNQYEIVDDVVLNYISIDPSPESPPPRIS